MKEFALANPGVVLALGMFGFIAFLVFCAAAVDIVGHICNGKKR